MSVIQYKLSLDLRRNVHQVLVMKEGDVNAREICITVTDNGKIFNPDGYSADCKWKKPDGTYVFNTCPVRQGQIFILCTRQMLAVSGTAKVEIVLYRDVAADATDQNVISTMKFHVSISPSVVCDKDVESSDEFGALTEIMLKNKQLAASLEELMEDSTLVHTSDLGVPGGVATLSENGTIPAAQLPSYVDDVKDGHAVHVVVDGTTGTKTASEFIYTGENEPCIPETDKIYIDVNEGITYRWSGSTFVSIGSPLSLGTTSSMAFPGDRGLSLEQAVEDLSTPATWQKNGLLSSEDKKRIDNYANLREIKITLPAASWSGTAAPYTQTVKTEDLSAYNNCSVEMDTDAVYAQTAAAADAKIGRITYENGQLTFTADGAKPSLDIPLLLCVGTSINVVSVPACFEEMIHPGMIANNDTTEEEGFVADARIVKAHGDEIDAVHDSIVSLNNNLMTSLSNIDIIFEKYTPNGNEYLIGESFNPGDYKFFLIELIYGNKQLDARFVPRVVLEMRNSTENCIRVSCPQSTMAADVWLRSDNKAIGAFANTSYLVVKVYGIR